jgi:hypothetical protein
MIEFAATPYREQSALAGGRREGVRQSASGVFPPLSIWVEGQTNKQTTMKTKSDHETEQQKNPANSGP